MITYKTTNTYPLKCVAVYLDKKYVGDIFERTWTLFGKGWQYFPKGQKEGGEMFQSLALCKKSLEK